MSLLTGGVWLDARGTQSATHAERGIARYITEQTRALIEAQPDLEVFIGLDPNLPVPPSLEAFRGADRLRWHTRTEPEVEQLPSIYHVMSPFESRIELEDIWPEWVRSSGCRTVVTLYDLIPLVMRDRYLTDSNWGIWGTVWMARLGLIRAADQVLTISRQTATDAGEHLGIPEERLTVIDSGVSWELSSLVGIETRGRIAAEEELSQASSRIPPLRRRRRSPQEPGGDDRGVQRCCRSPCAGLTSW